MEGGDPTLAGCTIRDHALRDHADYFEGSGNGIFVSNSAAGMASVGDDCVFARNAEGDVVRE